jgi:formimidoylglutamate deiminase
MENKHVSRLIARRALLPTGWHDNVLLAWDEEGYLVKVEPHVPMQVDTPPVVDLVIPGMPNLHSHAFQRAMAGLSEYRANATDNFWSWRTLMYAFAQRVTPPTLKAIAVQLYIEMLKAGFTSVCEFHYVHHDVGGKPYENRAELAQCLVEAAAEVGIGLTLLPVLYQYSGFNAKPPHPGQARFINSPRSIIDLLQTLQRSHPQHAALRYGVAPHSLRAVSPTSLKELLAELDRWDPSAPIHIHIAEQVKEVEESLSSLGARPVQWLLDNAEVDSRWCLVHATHMTADETRALAGSGAVAGICPTTEANLGDGIFNGAAYAAHSGSWGVGSDSHVSINMREELRLYEYTQRLLMRQRNVLTGGGKGSVGKHLYTEALAGGATATGRLVAGLTIGQRADLLVLDETHPDLCGRWDDQILDSFIFCNHPRTPIRDVMVGGRWVVERGQHKLDVSGKAEYAAAIQSLIRDDD